MKEKKRALGRRGEAEGGRRRKKRRREVSTHRHANQAI